jgi:branched-chain amino acid transport system ATP-binding protein
LSVEENLKVAFSETRDEWNLEKIYELFPVLGDRRNQMGGSLSGGEQQMLAIGRGLMTNPSLLLMDEPTEGLSPILVQNVGNVVKKLQASGISLLLVEQKLRFAIKYTGYIHIMNKGKIVFSLSPAELEDNQEMWNRYLGV